MEAIQSGVTYTEVLRPLIPSHAELVSLEINKFLFENREAGDEVFKTVLCEKEVKRIKLLNSVLKDVNFFLRFEKGEMKLSIIIPEQSKKIIAEGRVKKIFASETVTLRLNAFKAEKFSSVVMHTKDFDEINEWYKTLLYSVWVREKPQGVYLAPFFEKVGDELYTQERFDGDFHSYLFKSKHDKAMCLRDVTRAILWINSRTCCHGDVKNRNFLIKEMVDFEGIRRPVALLTDFDHSDGPGSDKKILDLYPFWDPCMNHGILNPYTDLYGLVFNYVLMVFKFDIFVLAGIRDRVFQDLRAGNDKGSIEYCPFPCQLEQEKEIWALFIDVCKESTRLYAELEQIEDAVSEAQVNEAIREIETFKERFTKLADNFCV